MVLFIIFQDTLSPRLYIIILDRLPVLLSTILLITIIYSIMYINKLYQSKKIQYYTSSLWYYLILSVNYTKLARLKNLKKLQWVVLNNSNLLLS